jgi:hypothetical protein
MSGIIDAILLNILRIIFMAQSYTTVCPVQQFDDMACWAAAMEWWLTFMGGSRPQMSQYDITAIKAVADKTFIPPDTDSGNANPNFGGLTEDGMKALFNYSPFRMKYKRYSYGALKMSSLKKRLIKSPIVIIYYDSSVNGFHANVVVHIRELLAGLETIVAMEPRDPSFTDRFLNWFKSDEVYIAWAD